jgi:hypothetical protein
MYSWAFTATCPTPDKTASASARVGASGEDFIARIFCLTCGVQRQDQLPRRGNTNSYEMPNSLMSRSYEEIRTSVSKIILILFIYGGIGVLTPNFRIATPQRTSSHT